MPENRIVIEAGRSEKQYWRDLWRYRELLYFLAWRDILVRYKQTVVGVAWSILRPLLTMVIGIFVFQHIAQVDTGGTPYAIFSLCGILPWQFFSTAMAESGNSLVSNANLITKVYFPRMIVPASSVVTSLVDFFISFLILIAFFAWYHVKPGPNVVFLPFFILLCFAAALGVGIFIGAIMAKYRDFRFILPFVTQFGMFVSPVYYMSKHLPGSHKLGALYGLNPMLGVIDGFRWSLLGGEHKLYLPSLVLSILATTALLIGGIWYFRKVERKFADII